MFWTKQVMSERAVIALGLFLIGALHTLINATFIYAQRMEYIPLNLDLYCKIVLYTSAVIVAFSHQAICRVFGLKQAMIGGLFLNFFGLLILTLNRLTGGNIYFLLLDMVLFGAALTSVLNGIMTFIVLQFPKKTGVAIAAFFAFANGGVMLAPLLIGIFDHWDLGDALYPLLMVMIFIAIWHVQTKMYDPPYPKHLRHLRKGTVVWKELHYRLGLFVVAVIGYGLTESSFSMWGFQRIAQKLGAEGALNTVSLFWLFLIVGQIVLLVPLYFYSTKKIFYFLIMLTGISLYLFFRQQTLIGFITFLAAGGIGCAVIFPILISMLEREISCVARASQILPYIETSLSFIIGGHVLGNGIVDIWIALLELAQAPLDFNPLMGVIFIATTGLIGLGLSLTAPNSSR